MAVGRTETKSGRRVLDDHVGQLVGRDPELRHVRAAMERVRAASASLTVVEGEPGIGKTRLVREVEVLARAEGWFVVRFSCAELDADRPFEAVSIGLADVCAELGDSVPFELGEAAQALRFGASDGFAHGDRITTLVLEGLRELSRSAPCLIVFEDAHWIDDATAQVLWGLARRHQNSPMLVMATVRPSTETRVVALRRGLDGLGAATLMLNPLSTSDGELVALSVLGAAVDDTTRDLLREAGGNPLFIVELVRGRGELGGATGASGTGVPASLRGLVERRLASLPAQSQAALADAALLGIAFDLDDLVATLEVSMRDAVALLEPALSSRVLVSDETGMSFRHGVVQSIVARSRPDAFRRQRHREIAVCLAGAGRSATRVAEHVWLSRPGPEADAAEWMRSAALEVRALSLDSALTWLERAYACAPAAERFGFAMDIATVLVLLNRTTEAETVCRSAELPALAAEQTRRDQVLAAVASMSGPLRAAEAGGHLEAIEACFERENHRRIEPLGWRSVLSILAGRLDEGRELATSSLAIPFDSSSEHLRSQALEALSLVALLEGNVEEAQRRGSEAVSIHKDRPDRFSTQMMTTPHFTYALSMLATEPIGSVMAVLHDGFQICDRAGHLLARLHLEPLMATAHFVRGDIVHADAVVSRTLERNAYAQTGVAIPTATALAGYISVLRDDVEGGLTLAALALSELLGGGSQAATAEFAVWCLASIAEETGDSAKAEELLVAVWDLIAKDAGLYSITPDLVRLTRRTRPEFATDVMERCELRAARSSTPLDRAHAHATRGWLRDDWSALCKAADAWKELDWAFSGTRLLHLGLSLAPDGSRASSYADIRASWESMELPRMVRLLDTSHPDLARREGRTRRPGVGPESLSQAELAVVRLVGEGLTNKQIAERLFVSHRTVDTHVSHAFSKLGVNGRVALAGLVAKGIV